MGESVGVRAGGPAYACLTARLRGEGPGRGGGLAGDGGDCFQEVSTGDWNCCLLKCLLMDEIISSQTCILIIMISI